MPVVLTSSRNGQGLEELCASVWYIADESNKQPSVAKLSRQLPIAVGKACGRPSNSLKRAAELVLANGGNELVAVELRAALDEIGSVVGAVYTDDLLDRIFGTFCIGK